ncbi:CaiB/BaiF CoA transferase family protein [Cytobacillus horneckiae]|uniref:CaiB/BaiF CoA transferase family protein n=1 Tax=Cytobacillus horneckiae TaxID=549687 RepID=UPI0008254119|nr:CaiB/BaiF CoA-transferase family protein [Cytobacillus horneckiae]MCM3180440.1 CoA transferase [Cytobacillus horneckiae]MEC1156311.1 CaiB/BaiF CoA-transferase family protein [Cytobacillus horneckiae]MED2938329.1 CaiB/BaiF CoA-transferase family protein [Cytobacillus horneckiae]
MSLALESLRVLDLTRLLPGPFSTMLLADYGAEVIKIEDTGTGDYVREMKPKIGENSALFQSVNRNKKSICLDLKTEQGKEILLKLVEKADVLVESFRPGVMERLGIGYDVLKQVNQRLIYCAITGYGQTGPYSKKPGHDINYISYAGILEYMGVSDRKPIVPPVQLADLGGGALMGTIGILMALIERESSGKGQFVDISMMDGALSLFQVLLPAFLASKEQPKRGEHFLAGGRANYEVYQTKDGLYLSVGSTELKFWKRFCETIGREDFIQKIHAPIKEQDSMKEEIQSIIIKKSRQEWLGIFDRVETCVSPVNRLEDLEKDPQFIERKMFQTYRDAENDEVKLISPPIMLSETPGVIRNLAPKLGEHTNEILSDIGFSDQQIEVLLNQHIIKNRASESASKTG